MTRSNNSKGFTLIELLIVVAIIAILAAIAVPNFLEAQTRAKVSRAQADMRTIATGIEAYAVDNNVYPSLRAPNHAVPPGNGLNGPSVFSPNVGGVSSRFIRLTTPIAYLTSVFRDPFIPDALQFAKSPTTEQRLDGYDTYDYVDAKSFLQGGRFQNPSPVGAATTSGGAWRLSGTGPDTRQAFGGGAATGPRAAGAVTNQRGVDYDPTNGTVSEGDIVRVGGVGQLLTTGGLPAIDRVQKKYNF